MIAIVSPPSGFATHDHKDAVIMARLFTLVVGLCMLGGCTIGLFETAPRTTATNVLPQYSPERTAAVPEGAKVEIERRYASDQIRGTTTGVVMKASADGLALANCTNQGTSITGTPIVSKLPYTSRLFTNTGVGREEAPVMWVPASEINDVKVLEPAPADYVASSIEIKTAGAERIGVDFDYTTEATSVTGLETRIE